MAQGIATQVWQILRCYLPRRITRKVLFHLESIYDVPEIYSPPSAFQSGRARDGDSVPNGVYEEESESCLAVIVANSDAPIRLFAAARGSCATSALAGNGARTWLAGVAQVGGARYAAPCLMRGRRGGCRCGSQKSRHPFARSFAESDAAAEAEEAAVRASATRASAVAGAAGGGTRSKAAESSRPYRQQRRVTLCGSRLFRFFNDFLNQRKVRDLFIRLLLVFVRSHSRVVPVRRPVPFQWSAAARTAPRTPVTLSLLYT